jgi:MFS family permease
VPARSDVRSQSLRPLFIAIGAVVFVDTMFYAAVAPLLTTLAREFHLSKLSAGVLTAAYPVGTLIGSLPGGALAVRAGPRPTVYAGLGLLACSSLAFGLVHDVVLLDVARFAQGIGGACSWAGGLAWLIAEVPVEQRGGAIGGSLGAAIGGALFGPVVGTLAQALSRAVVFSAVVVIAAGLIAWVSRLPAPRVPARDQGTLPVWAAVRRPAIALGMWLVALPAIASGAVNVLGPLRLGRLGAGPAAIGATFLIAAAFEALMSPVVGRVSDRRGRMLPLRVGLSSAGVVLLFFTLPESAVLLAAVIVLTAVALGSFWAPAMAMLSDAAEGHGLALGYALALINLAWAGGQIVGSGGGGALAKAAGDEAPFAVCAALCLLTLAVVLARPVADKLELGLISRTRR